MGSAADATETAPRTLLHEERGGETALSVCCMTSGRRPALLAVVLAALRAVADEVVVAAEAPRAADVHAAVDGIADIVFSFPPTAPADRPIAWLFRACAGRWILNVDDDEVASPALLAALPELVERDDVTHAWIARRWLHPTAGTYIASSPWGTEFQLRLVLADERFLGFSDEFHRPVICHGPSTYVDAPLWHLDTLLNPAAARRRKAAAYERERPGMRIGGSAHNLGIYVPELRGDLELAPVPDVDRAAITAALAGRPSPAREVETTFVEMSPEPIDGGWVGAPFPDDLYDVRLELLSEQTELLAGAQATVDVRVENRGSRVWRWGREARPALFLSYRWRRESKEVADEARLRTVLPVDVRPGASEIVPVHVVAPATPGRYELLIDFVHEGIRRFGEPATAEVDVRRLRRLAVVSTAERLPELAEELALPPRAELVALLRDEADRNDYGDHACVVGLRPYLLAGTERRGRVSTLVRVLLRFAAIARRRPDDWRRSGYGEILEFRDEADALVVDSPTWEADAAFGREWAWLVATVLLWRLGGKEVLVSARALPGGPSLRARGVRVLLRLAAGRPPG